MKTLTLLLLLVIISGCGTFKKLKEKHEIEIKTDVTQTVGTTTIEKVDTLIPVKPSKVKLTRPLSEIIDGNRFIASNGKSGVEIQYDKDTKSITAFGITEAFDVPIIIDKTTHENVATVDKSSSQSKDAVVRTENKTSSGFAWGFMVAVVVLLFLIILLFWLNRKF